VVDAAINAWTSIVTNFNQPGGGNNINVNISMQARGYGGVTSITNFNNGWPTAANIAFGTGNDQGASYFLDPTPNESSEFQGSIVNAYSGLAQVGSPANGKLDLYTVALHELCHALGFDAGTRLQTTGYATNTGVLDTPGQPALGYLWVFHGPSITHLTTSDNDGTSDAGGPEHTAYTNQTVTWQGQTLQGAEDLMNGGLGGSERRLIPAYVALMLHDAYNYTVAPVWSFPTIYITYNQTTQNVLIRGSSGPNADAITIEPIFVGTGTLIVATIAVGNPVPGTDPNPSYFSQSFWAGSVSSTTVDTTAGADTVNIEDLFALAPIAPVTVTLGTGTDTVNIQNLPPNPCPVTVNLGSGTDTVNIQSSYAPVAVKGGTGSDAVNVQSVSAPLSINGGTGKDTIKVGSQAPNLNGTLAGITAPITVTNTSVFSTLSVDDSGDNTAQTGTVSGTSITGLGLGAAGVINYTGSQLASLAIQESSGGATVAVTGTSTATTLWDNGSGIVNIGNAGSLANILGPITVENEVSTDTVNINDQNDTTVQNKAILSTVIVKGSTLGRLSGLVGIAPISWDYPDTQQVNLNTGQAGITLSVLGTGVPTFINGNTLGTNTLVGANLETTWNVTGANQGDFSNANASATFAGIQNLIGGNNGDDFIFSDGATLSGTINGGGGSDGLSLAAYTADLTVNITGGDLGSVPGVVGAFLNISGVSTGSGNDSFVFSNGASITSIDGGTGINTLDASAYTSSRTVYVYGTNSGMVSGIVFEFAEIQNVTTGSGNDTFVFDNGASLAGTIDGGTGMNTLDALPGTAGLTFAIKSANGGSVAGLVGIFTHVQNLLGAGAGGNVFAISPAGSISGELDGGFGGNNWLDYNAWKTPMSVNLATGTAAAVTGGVSNIQNVRGGQGGDTLTGNSLGNILIGGTGNDVIQGGSGRSILIGGAEADQVTGGSADDIVIGGIVTYANQGNFAALEAILAEWQSTDSYLTRINKIKNLGVGPANQYKLVWGSTVLDDAAPDTLTGGAGTDWFFAKLANGVVDTITDLTAGEHVD
jgi:hypothetical protein